MSDNIKEKNVVELPGISFGTVLQIQTEGQGMAASRLIGVDPGAFLIIRTPAIADIATQLYEKNHIVVRYFFSGWVHAFRCTLLSLIKEPLRLAVLSYPESIEKINIRKHDRVDCNISAEVLIASRMFPSVVRNINAGGLLLTIDGSAVGELPQLKLQDEVILTLHREENRATTLRGIVRNVKIDKQVMAAGVEFSVQGVGQGEKKDGKQWLENLISENLR
jgi:c-di-GMP-binding flagellar brake protein YcgR